MAQDQPPRLLAVSDLHVAYPANRKFVEELHPQAAGDCLLLAGDIGELLADVEWALSVLSGRFERVIWTPGNHELWTHPEDPVKARGLERYQLLVETCRCTTTPFCRRAGSTRSRGWPTPTRRG